MPQGSGQPESGLLLPFAMKVAALADCHLDHGRHNGQWNDTAWNAAIDSIADGGYDACLIVGDLFERGQAAGEAINLAGWSMKRLARAGVPVVYVVGNHEWIRVPPGHRPASHALGVIDGVQVAAEAGWVRAGDLSVACLPWPTAEAEPQPESARRLAELADSHEGPRLAAAHAMVTGAKAMTRHGSEMDLASASTSTAALGDIDVPQAFSRTLLGHVHRRQNLSETCSYVGSIDRITFADEGQKRGYSELVWDDENRAWSETLIEVATREFRTLAPGDPLDGLDKGTFIRLDLDKGDQGDFDWKQARRLGLRICSPTGGKTAIDYDSAAEQAEEAMHGQAVDLMDLLGAWMKSSDQPERLHQPIREEAIRRGWAA